jgi:hypothetical protein
LSRRRHTELRLRAISFGRADGAFLSGSDRDVKRVTSSLTLGDVNGDGKLDLVLRHPDDNSVGVWLGAGDGTFAHKADVAVAYDTSDSYHAHGVQLRALNRDGIPDLIVMDSLTSVALGLGDGAFGPITSYDLGTISRATLVGDLNGDGALDILSVDDAGPSTFLGRGDGTFAPPLPAVHGSVGEWIDDDSTLADFNGDGRLDIIVPLSSSRLLLLLGNGDGTFACPSFYNNGGILAVGDMNGDHRPDLVVADSVGTAILLNSSR